jgi:hypothetical protein
MIGDGEDASVPGTHLDRLSVPPLVPERGRNRSLTPPSSAASRCLFGGLIVTGIEPHPQ